MHILTIDTGTTNTRVSLWRDGVQISQALAPVGVRDTAISGSQAKLREAVRDTMGRALEHSGVGADQIKLVLASGMITSSLGLHELAHLPTAAGREQLAAAMQCVAMPDVCAQPIWFIPGVRNDVSEIDPYTCEAMDMMRGEETEAIGLIESLGLQGSSMLVLPGSHTKLVSLDSSGCISGCATTLAGELLQAITGNTILAKSLDSKFATRLSPEMVLAGAALAWKAGIGRACFSVRILEQFTASDQNARANFLLGAVLSGDVQTLKNSDAICMLPDMPLVIAGKGIVKQALALLIEDDAYFSGALTVIDDTLQTQLSGRGALSLAAARGLCGAISFRPHRGASVSAS